MSYSRFYQFCDAVEVCTCSVLTNYSHVHRTSKPAQKTCPDRTVWEYGKHWTDMRNGSNTRICQGISPSRESRNKADQPVCKVYGYWENEHSVECFNTHNESSPMYTDTSPRNTFFRTWLWFCCNEPFFNWQTYVFNPACPAQISPRNSAAPWWESTLVSRMINADFFQRQCPLFFPEVNGHTYGSAKGRTAEDVNRWTGGWLKRNTTRLLYSNGYAFTASGYSGPY